MKTTYYQRHREKILEKQKLLYNTDKEYRKRRIELASAYQKRKAKERKLAKAKIKREKKIWKNFRMGNNIIKCCRIGYVAFSIERTSQTIRKWHKMGYLPETFKYNGIRYYTYKHYNLITTMFNRYGSKNTLKLFFKKVRDNWNN